MLAVALRVLAIVHIGLAIGLTAAGFYEPSKSSADLVARMVLWPTLALLSWALADVIERPAPPVPIGGIPQPLRRIGKSFSVDVRLGNYPTTGEEKCNG